MFRFKLFGLEVTTRVRDLLFAAAIGLAVLLDWRHDAVAAALKSLASQLDPSFSPLLAAAAAFVAGALATAFAAAAWPRGGKSTGPGRTVFDAGRLGALLAVAMLGLTVLAIVAVDRSQVSAAGAAMAVLFAALALAAGGPAVDALQRGEGVNFESHWGGLGGNQGGWRLSPVATLLILTVGFAAAARAALTLPAADPNAAGKTAPAPKAAPAAGARPSVHPVG